MDIVALNVDCSRKKQQNIDYKKIMEPKLNRAKTTLNINFTNFSDNSIKVESDKKTSKIAISASNCANFYTQKVIRDLTEYFQLNGWANMFWTDYDRVLKSSVYRLPLRLRILEKSKVVFLFLSKDYFTNSFSFLEFKLISYRMNLEKDSLTVIAVETEEIERENDFFKTLRTFSTCIVQFLPANGKPINFLADELQKYIEAFAIPWDVSYRIMANKDQDNSFESKKPELWTNSEVSDWLKSIEISSEVSTEFFKKNIDGTLLICMTEDDLSHHMNIKMNQTRKRIIFSRDNLIRLRCGSDPRRKKLRPDFEKRVLRRNDLVYVLYDGRDIKIFKKISKILDFSGFVISQSHEINKNSCVLSQPTLNLIDSCAFVLVLTTQDFIENCQYSLNLISAAVSSGKRIVLGICQPSFNNWPPILATVLSKCTAIDLAYYLADISEEKMLRIRSLFKHIVSHRRAPHDLNFSHDFINFDDFLSENCKNSKKSAADVILFFHWDSRDEANSIEILLKKNKISCWSELNSTAINKNIGKTIGKSSKENKATNISYANFFRSEDHSLQKNIESIASTCSVALFLITSDYICGHNFQKEMLLAAKFNRPIIFVLVELCIWPPLFATKLMRRIVKLNLTIDMSSKAMYQRNHGFLVRQIRQKTSSINHTLYDINRMVTM